MRVNNLNWVSTLNLWWDHGKISLLCVPESTLQAHSVLKEMIAAKRRNNRYVLGEAELCRRSLRCRSTISRRGVRRGQGVTVLWQAGTYSVTGLRLKWQRSTLKTIKKTCALLHRVKHMRIALRTLFMYVKPHLMTWSRLRLSIIQQLLLTLVRYITS